MILEKGKSKNKMEVTDLEIPDLPPVLLREINESLWKYGETLLYYSGAKSCLVAHYTIQDEKYIVQKKGKNFFYRIIEKNGIIKHKRLYKFSEDLEKPSDKLLEMAKPYLRM